MADRITKLLNELVADQVEVDIKRQRVEDMMRTKSECYGVRELARHTYLSPTAICHWRQGRIRLSVGALTRIAETLEPSDATEADI